jgi:hypothetical protein
MLALFRLAVKSGLLEMIVSRQRFGQPMLFNDNKRNVIDERPILVRTRGEQRQSSLKDGVSF